MIHHVIKTPNISLFPVIFASLSATKVHLPPRQLSAPIGSNNPGLSYLGSSLAAATAAAFTTSSIRAQAAPPSEHQDSQKDPASFGGCCGLKRGIQPEYIDTVLLR
jgi:hypothetical protein